MSDDYRKHTSCLTEAERYEKKAAKSSSKRNPQQEWMDIVESCASSAAPHLRSYMETMAGLDNIPRKEKQFINFTSNSLNLRGSNKKIVDEIWNCLKQERERRSAEKEKQQQKEQEQKQLEKQKKQESEKQVVSEKQASEKTSEKVTVKMGGEELSIDLKKVHKATKKVLKKAPNHSMKLKELRKLLGKELGLPKSAKKRLKKVLTSNKKVKVDGKMISLN
mmetsp:Transcript_18830/g.35128  ORF Transcript_18830/g.35128 Transcript_18830/m.35128 type:complete len:221 (-) Transcript_18830:810-1472(-)